MSNWINTGNISYKFSKNIHKLISNGQKLVINFAGFDFDHTLVKPKNGRVHSSSIEDMELCFDNITENFIKLVNEEKHIFIISNQSGYYDSDERQKIILGKFDKFLDQLPNLVSDNITILISLKKDFCRKPNLGILDFLNTEFNIDINKNNSFYVGDAAGRICNSSGKKDFTNTDRLFAINASINFFTPEKYFLGGKMEKELYGVPRFVSSKTFVEFEYGSYGIEDWSINDYDVFVIVGPPSTGKSYIDTI